MHDLAPDVKRPTRISGTNEPGLEPKCTGIAQTYHAPRRLRDNMNGTDHKETTTWPELAEGLFHFLTGRGASIAYHFDNMTLGVPSSARPDSPQAVWKINGGITIRTSEK